ncbi:hypothetical protein ALC57_17558 [Trachymyrmex cornetzi]|uniref:Uncharacterized protein n=1 Tax=Trachymyrmex cornetzi TaxID=471704 RepID=A0A195DBX0_9HYME|nr:hypothetical protein ALC57_17558 [Trachymyrmex cornetzi]
MLVAAVATVAVDIVVVVVVFVVVFLFLLVLLVLPFTYPSSWSLGGTSRLIPPQIFPLRYRGHKERVEDVMHAGQRDVFLLPGYKSSARKKVVKFVVAVSCGKKFA